MNDFDKLCEVRKESIDGENDWYWIKMNAALGSENTFMGMKIQRGSNCGIHRMSGFGHISVFALDTMNFPILDLLQLDVEGFEEQALNGAEKTIKRTRPIIVVERSKTDSLLESYDYKFYKRSGHADYVWIPSEEI